MADPQDRLWIDLNGDGRFDPAAEQFLFATVLNLDGSRYVVRSDELGTRLAIEPLARRRHAAAGLEGARRFGARPGQLQAPSSCTRPPWAGMARSSDFRHRAGHRAGRRVPARDGDRCPGRPQGRPALVVRLLRQRSQGRAHVVQGREGRDGHDRPDRDAELRDQPGRQASRRSAPATTSACSPCSTRATGS